MTSVEILLATQRRLAQLGWQQGHSGGEAGPNCLAAALHFAQDIETMIDGAAPGNVAADALCVICGTQRLTEWNDAPGRTLAEVDQAIGNAVTLLEATR